MTDFEGTLKRLLNENVDATLGPRRPAPELDLPAANRRGFRPWVVPLVVAACLAAALIATLTTTKVLSDHRAVTPASSRAPSTTVVQLADARIWLPAGWGATVSSRDYSAVDNESITWCLGPVANPCQAWLERSVQDPGHDYNLAARYDPTVPGGTPTSYLEVCGDASRGSAMLEGGDRDFGGRLAYYGVFDFKCQSGPDQQVIQYLVPAGPAFELYALSSDPALQATMAEIARRSTLPKQTSALPYYDSGYVRSLKSVAGHIELTIERVALGPSGPIKGAPRTTRYMVSPATWSDNPHPTAVGQLATVATDGTTVFEVSQLYLRP